MDRNRTTTLLILIYVFSYCSGETISTLSQWSSSTRSNDALLIAFSNTNTKDVGINSIALKSASANIAANYEVWLRTIPDPVESGDVLSSTTGWVSVKSSTITSSSNNLVTISLSANELTIPALCSLFISVSSSQAMSTPIPGSVLTFTQAGCSITVGEGYSYAADPCTSSSCILQYTPRAFWGSVEFTVLTSAVRVCPMYPPTSSPTPTYTSPPSVKPSVQPSLSPTQSPTPKPTPPPTAAPSVCPSTAPTVSPSARPSLQPTCAPTINPTRLPSSAPSAHPTSIPTGKPSCSPTLEPSGLPTTVPSASPSTVPLSAPTGEPSGEPTSTPSAVPSGSPTGEPSGEPTSTPSSVPSSSPTGEPSGEPTSAPSSVPSSSPTGEPSGEPTSTPSAVPSSSPTGEPSGEPTSTPSAVPSSRPTGKPSGEPTSIPSGGPTRCPSSCPTSLPSISSRPTASPSHSPAPDLTILGTNMSRTTINVTVALSKEGRAYCAVFAENEQPPVSTALIILHNNVVVIDATSDSGVIYLRSLQPATTYDLYCVSESSYGVPSTYGDMLNRKASVATSCCKTVTIRVREGSYFSGEDITSALQVYSDGAPSTSVTVTLTATRDGKSVTAFVPPTLTLTRRAWQTPQPVAFSASPSGEYTIVAAVSGEASGEFEVEFQSGRTFSVLSSAVSRPAPVSLSAVFQRDGLSFLFTFNSPTNVALKSAQFRCSEVLSFVSAREALCEWLDNTQLKVTLGGNERVGPGSVVSVLDDTVRASCSHTYFTEDECSQWPATAAIPVVLEPPPSAVVPQPIISAPTLVGPCDELVLDFSSSTGAGGREWTSVAFAVSSDDEEGAARAKKFFPKSFEANLPVTIPLGTLQAGFYYHFQIVVCNFLGTCGTGFHRVLATKHHVPVVFIPGQKSRLIPLSETVFLQAVGYITDCAGGKVYSDLEYIWTIERDGVALDIVNVASFPSHFKVPPHQLHLGSMYRIQVTVRSVLTGLYSTAETLVWTVQKDIVAKLSGGAWQYVRMQDTLHLDASESYDSGRPDPSNITGLSFTWNCFQTKPVLSEDCGLIFNISSNRAYALVSPSPLTSVGSVYSVTVTVFDSERQGTAQTLITVSNSDSPKISLSTKNNVDSMTSSSELVILASIEVTYPTAANWSEIYASIDLQSKAKAVTAKPSLSAGTHFMHLVIPGHTLVSTQHPYMFVLKVADVSVALAVHINAAPSPGLFTIYPAHGIALNTTFTFAASAWSDEDYPISYEFGYLQAGGSGGGTPALLVVRGRSELSFAYSELASGYIFSEATVIGEVQVYDSLHAVNVASSNVTISGSVPVLDEMKHWINNKMSLGRGNLDIIKSTLSLSSTMLNARNCSTVPCESLFRRACLDTHNTCGACLPGYVGVEGDDNSPCVQVSQLQSIEDGRTCSTNADCSAWELCNITSGAGFCTPTNKKCGHDCSGRGVCSYVLSHTGALVDSCRMGDVTCAAVCACDEDFAGHLCHMSQLEFELRNAMRHDLLGALDSLIVSEEPSTDVLISWQRALLTIALGTDELTPRTYSNILTTASHILHTGSDLSLSYLSMLDLLASVNAAALIATTDSQQENVAAEVIDFLDNFTSVIATNIVSGQAEVDSLNGMFRTAMRVLPSGDKGDDRVTLPVTDTESLYNLQPFSAAVSLPGVTVSAMTLKAAMFENSTELASNVLRVTLLEGPLGTQTPVFTVVLQNNAKQSYEHIESTRIVKTTCEAGNWTTVNHTCPGGPVGDLTVSHQCNGTAVYMESRCPNITTFPTCKVLGSSMYTCEVIAATSLHITCRCLRMHSGRKNVRVLTSDDTLGVLVVASLSETAVTEFATTLSRADELNSVSDLRKTMTVILMYGILWTGGLLIVFLFSARRTHQNLTGGVAATTVDHEKALAKASKLPEDIKRYLLSYVNEIFPSVFQSTSGSLRVWNEITKHHRYLLLLTAKGRNADSVRTLTCIHLLTVQSMLMFILAVFYDVQVDDIPLLYYD